MQIVPAAIAAGKQHSAIMTMMPLAYSTPPIVCTGGPLSATDADLLIVPWYEDDAPGAVGIDAASGGELARALGDKEFQGKAFELFFTPITDRSWRARRGWNEKCDR